MSLAHSPVSEIERQTVIVFREQKVTAIPAFYSSPLGQLPDARFISVLVSSYLFSLLIKVNKQKYSVVSCY